MDEVNFRANESRGQTCLDYAECSRKWTKSPKMDEVNFRANESRGQTCLDYAECSRKWTKSNMRPIT